MSGFTQNPLISVRFYPRTPFLSDFTSEPPFFCQFLSQNLLLSVRFYLRAHYFVRFYLKASKFVSHFTSQSDIFCQMVPQNLFCCHFYLRTSFFLSDFTSECVSFFQIFQRTCFFCQILPQVLFFSSWQYLRISLLLSFLSQNFHPLHPLSDFYLRTSFFSIRFNLKSFYFIQKSVRYTPTQTRKIIPVLYLPPLVLSVLLSCSAKKNFKPCL